jgi:hypothetical protein
LSSPLPSESLLLTRPPARSLPPPLVPLPAEDDLNASEEGDDVGAGLHNDAAIELQNVQLGGMYVSIGDAV